MLSPEIIVSAIGAIGIIVVALIQNRHQVDNKKENEATKEAIRLVGLHTSEEIKELSERNRLTTERRTQIELAEREMNERSRDLALETAKAVKSGSDGNGELAGAIVAFEKQRSKTRETISAEYDEKGRLTAIMTNDPSEQHFEYDEENLIRRIIYGLPKALSEEYFPWLVKLGYTSRKVNEYNKGVFIRTYQIDDDGNEVNEPEAGIT